MYVYVYVYVYVHTYGPKPLASAGDGAEPVSTNGWLACVLPRNPFFAHAADGWMDTDAGCRCCFRSIISINSQGVRFVCFLSSQSLATS